MGGNGLQWAAMGGTVQMVGKGIGVCAEGHYCPSHQKGFVEVVAFT